MSETIENQKLGGDSLHSVVGASHPQDGREWDCQCARCGSSLEWHECSACGGEGITGPGELYEQDPLWYDQDDYETCHQCGGEASFPSCLSSEEWCKNHPIKGRENIDSGTPEWFVVNRSNVRVSGSPPENPEAKI